jgi:hypothetical protein
VRRLAEIDRVTLHALKPIALSSATGRSCGSAANVPVDRGGYQPALVTGNADRLDVSIDDVSGALLPSRSG